MGAVRRCQRDLFPLPTKPPGAPSTGGSRCIRRRQLRVLHAAEWEQEALVALNELSGASGECDRPNLAQQ
eukprot:3515814-Lingulodinium_polyedra.AAC.1